MQLSLQKSSDACRTVEGTVEDCRGSPAWLPLIICHSGLSGIFLFAENFLAFFFHTAVKFYIKLLLYVPQVFRNNFYRKTVQNFLIYKEINHVCIIFFEIVLYGKRHIDAIRIPYFSNMPPSV
jgi:hypothetical protein